MSKALKNRMIVILSMLLVSCIAVGVGVFGFAGASTPFTVNDFELSSVESSVMIDGEDGKDGLTFSVKTSTSDYEGINSLVGEGKDYVSMETGMVIAPNYYNDEIVINETNMFGANARYDWAEWNGETYEYEGNKIRVININANDWKEVGNDMVYTGSIVDILRENVAEEFYAVAYVKLTDANGVNTFIWSEDAVSSMAYEVQIAIENGTLTNDKASYAQANFVDVVTEKYTYTTEYYKKVVDGYELIESVVSENTYKLDTEVTAEVKNYSEQNLEYIEGYEKEVASGKVKANDKLTLKLYYGDAEAEVINFNTLSNVVVTKGAKVLIETPAPVDQYGKLLDVYFDVVDANGGHVSTYTDEDGKYFYANGTEYTITYAVYPYDKKVTIKETTVQVAGVETINVEYDKVVEIGKAVEIKAESGLYNPEYTYSVVKDVDGSNVAVANGKFTPDTIGYYTVNVKATYLGKEAETSYKVFAREPGKKGEIESFFKGWEDLRSANGYGLHGWSITDTATSGIKNHLGLADTFATIKVNPEDANVMVWIDPLYDLDTYKSMIAEGYTNVTMYIYSDASSSHLTELITDPMVGSFLNEATLPLGANRWTKVTANLADVVYPDASEKHEGCIIRSFLSGYNIYAEERFGFLNVDNSAGEEFNIYISDLYVTKNQEITAVEGTTKTFSVGDKIDVSTYVNAIDGVDFKYSIENVFAKTPIEEVNGEYTFKANGNYVLRVVPASKDILGELTIEFSVTDSVTAENGWKKYELTGELLTVNFADLNASFKNGNETLSASPFAVYFDGKEIDKTETGFTATAPGNYKVYYKANYGSGLTTYAVYNVDVYTAETEYLMSSASDFIATRYWSYSKLPTNYYGEYTVNGVTGNMFYVPASTGNHVVLFRPMYSKAYYEDIISNNDTCKVLFARHIEITNDNFFVKTIIPNKGDENFATGSYYDYIDLGFFVENYDKFANAYERELKVVKAGGSPAYNYAYSAKDCLYAANNSQTDKIAIEDLIIVRSYVDEIEYLIDVDTLNGASTYDARNIITADAKGVVDAYGSGVTYKLTDKFGNTIESSSIDLTNAFNKRLWKLEAIANGQAVYVGYVDIYATSDGFVWNDNPVWNKYSGTTLSNPTTGTEATLTKDGQEVNVTKYTYSGATTYNHFTVKPQHSKTYYELYRGKVTLKFDIYVEKLDATGNVDNTNTFAANLRWANTNGAYMSQYATSASAMNNKWLTVERSINRYLDKWSFVEFDGETTGYNEMVNFGMFLAYQVKKPTGTSSISFTDITFTVNN